MNTTDNGLEGIEGLFNLEAMAIEAGFNVETELGVDTYGSMPHSYRRQFTEENHTDYVVAAYEVLKVKLAEEYLNNRQVALDELKYLVEATRTKQDLRKTRFFELLDQQVPDYDLTDPDLVWHLEQSTPNVTYADQSRKEEPAQGIDPLFAF